MKKSHILFLCLGCGGMLLVVSPCLLGFLAAFIENVRDYPGKKEFEVEDNKISVYDLKTKAFGNTADAVRMADEFSDLLEAEAHVAFKGGSTFNPTTMEKFLTLCEINAHGVVFLCQVPDMRGYKDDVRDALAGLAWTTGQVVARKHHLPDDTALAVGLRGFGSYGTIWEGHVAGEPAVKSDGLDNRNRLYPYFVPELTK